MHKNVLKFMQSVVAFPVMALTLTTSPFTGMVGVPTAAAILSEQNRTLASEVSANKQTDYALEVAKVEAFFAKYDLPLADNAEKLVEAAVENDLPPYVIAAIGHIESTGGKFACKNNRVNAYGYGSCKGVKFESADEAIDTVAKILAGKGKTTSHFYAGKPLDERLWVYNGRANRYYVENIHLVMDQMEEMQLPIASTDTTNDSV